jgi:hypothetical protein
MLWLAFCAAFAVPARAQLLLESGLAPRDPSGLSFEVSEQFRIGHAFEVTAPSPVASAGGAFLAQPAGMSCAAFAAVVALDGPDAVPDPVDLGAAGLVASESFVVGDVAADYTAAFDGVVLAPGWYMLLLGTGAFGVPACALPLQLAAGWVDGNDSHDLVQLRADPPATFSPPSVVRMLVAPEPPAAAASAVAAGAALRLVRRRRRA